MSVVRRSRIFPLALLVAAAPGVASARSIILCRSAEQPDVTISLQDRRHRGQMISCISGRFVTDLTPCAPDGGYGLSAPTGTTPLGPLVMRWQDYADHLGGVASFHSNASSYTFGGGFMGGQGFKSSWTFAVSRLTGEGKLTLEDGNTVLYRCQGAKQQF